MIIKLTNMCTMGCSHCCENSTPDGEHMSMETFEKSLIFIKRTRPRVIIISGGEPTLHPNFKTMVRKLYNIVGKNGCIVTSNGLWLWENEELNHSKMKEYLGIGVKFQITNDPRYYPRYVPFVNHPMIVYENHIESLSLIGRAKNTYKERINIKAPKCYNFIAAAKLKANSFSESVKGIEELFKFCTPMIKVSGDVVPGEFGICKPIGTVEDSEETLYSNLVNGFKCDRCNCRELLPEFNKKILDIRKEGF